MAELNSLGVYTLQDVLGAYKDGRMLAMANTLIGKNTLMENAVWLEANGAIDHTYMVTTSLPEGEYRVINNGYPVEAVKGKSYKEGVSMKGSWSEVDTKLLQIQANGAVFRARRDALHASGIRRGIQNDMIYGSLGVNPASFNGLHVRTDDVSLDNVINAGGSGAATTSVYLIGWGAEQVYMVFPKGGSPSDIVKATDHGLLRVSGVESSTALMKYVTEFEVEQGFVVEDPRFLQAIKNGQIADSEAGGYIDTDFVDKMIEAYYRVPEDGRENLAFYANPRIAEFLTVLAKDKNNVLHTATDPFGKKVLSILGVPIRTQEAILLTEQAST